MFVTPNLPEYSIKKKLKVKKVNHKAKNQTFKVNNHNYNNSIF